MVTVIIVEDEKPAVKRLKKLLNELADVQILDCIDSVEGAVEWFNNHQAPDIAFFDIQLADGKSFSIFEKCQVKCPVVFTTAYDEYALKAFKVNSIDYLLKPVDLEELKNTWDKFLTISENKNSDYSRIIEELRSALTEKSYKSRFLIKSGEQFKFIYSENISFVFSDGGQSFLVDLEGGQYLIDEKLDNLELQLNPKNFHRISRKFIIRDSSIVKISNYFNNRLILKLEPDFNSEIIVSRERVSEFKAWLNR